MNAKLKLLSLSIICGVTLTSCFTGIEGTKRITLSRDDLKAVELTPEEIFLSDVYPARSDIWPEGKSFYVADKRTSILLECRSGIGAKSDSLKRGTILRYVDTRMLTAPDGRPLRCLSFTDGTREYQYAPLDRDGGDIPTSVDIPGLIDLDMVDSIASLMTGKTLWTLNASWLDRSGGRLEGRKFCAVRIDSVSPGSMIFPVTVDFTDDAGVKARLMMNFGNSGKESRSFSSLFSLSDPRRKYQSISDRVWRNIQRGVVETGMTKEECRLSKGNPTEVNTGRDYSSALLLWSYPDATVLYFEDDILRGINTYGADGIRR